MSVCHRLAILPLVLLAGCGSSSDSPSSGLGTLSVEACEARGVVVGDPGDGRTRQPDYRCPDGRRPIGAVAQGIEGAVCCAR